MVLEIIKQRCNRGEANGVNYFRDKVGLESDVLVQGRKTLKLVEVKAGQTIASNWAANHQKITGMFDKMKQGAANVVVYGGTERQEHNSLTYLPWHAFRIIRGKHKIAENSFAVEPKPHVQLPQGRHRRRIKSDLFHAVQARITFTQSVK